MQLSALNTTAGLHCCLKKPWFRGKCMHLLSNRESIEFCRDHIMLDKTKGISSELCVR